MEVLNIKELREVNITLKAAREKSGKTQLQVAKEVGVTEVTYQRYEYGEREPRASTANLIAEAVGATVESLWGGNPART